ncbi:alpha/beta fold hydrolase [Ethanoligenens harbinense]|uniref:Alpha/beta hydrolase fold protein n=1 Tax=Ethanoligenens harbinense (strain DSM 18485 / JCM 12961 / CGMCC 1.5033 / YUAN-3) TaxID=663278 RepID=E6U959_ETHHY|nr:alpha/beta hydrolase [Ethanoligenens harbinense]ADU27218.1 alpha/beta hydrolase fold protein [Ethanoligenens harbinense YUAN-3]AVQ96287.1 alpha/beta hydrolase [Ethanoligenens harbinense YUAN-3]AYF38946.1 alpha/beta hydrolase [Ethanoligenens harbinense]AYF41698.1 alpha/beta hydrolase [Ethanoligenens harbinense]QCN92528.1 alpha/beta hydrolase [Ethanoligenens harbinense]
MTDLSQQARCILNKRRSRGGSAFGSRKPFYRRRKVMSIILAALFLFIVFVAVVFNIQLSWATHALHSIKVRTIATTYGKLTYAQKGSGIPVLIAHGTDGGYDQALISGEVFDGSYRVICPSRFGYPGSDMPKDATPEAQADAYRQLLDKLGIDKAYVMGTSAGGPPALQFALEYPERTAGVILLSTGMPVRGKTIGNVPTFIFNDFTMWLGADVFKSIALQQLGISQNDYSHATAAEKQNIDEFLKTMLPMSERKQGFVNDMSSNYDMGLHYDDYPLEKITVPVLMIHAQDDTIAKYSDVETARNRFPNATWVIFDHGGHMLFGQDVSGAINKFIRSTPI